MAVSQNGWSVDPPRRSRMVPSTDVRVTVADGPAGDVLLWVLEQFHTRVESLELDGTRGELDDWGYASRPIRGSTVISNHASATAVDANATRHPLGVAGTFTGDQVTMIHRILSEVDHVVRWGGDYAGRVDEMHFEINANYATVAQVAARLAQEADMSQTDVNNLKGFIWEGGPSTSTGNPAIASNSIMGRLQNLEGFVYRGGPSTRDEDSVGVSPDSIMGRLKATEVALDEMRAMLAEILNAVRPEGGTQ